jgi:hypothetical protein
MNSGTYQTMDSFSVKPTRQIGLMNGYHLLTKHYAKKVLRSQCPYPVNVANFYGFTSPFVQANICPKVLFLMSTVSFFNRTRVSVIPLLLSRKAHSEFQMFPQTLPHPNISSQSFAQITPNSVSRSQNTTLQTLRSRSSNET